MVYREGVNVRAANVAVLLFDDVEVLNFAGPLQVFSATKLPDEPAPFHVFTCAEKTGAVWSQNLLSVNPQYPLYNCPAPDVLIIPGGWGIREQLANRCLLRWLQKTAPRCEIVLSVCTGALLLAKAGLLEGLSVTTHHEAIDLLRELAPGSHVRRLERIVDNGQFVIAAGISAGIDASLHVVARLLGEPVATATAEYMEHSWRRAVAARDA